MDSRRAQLIVQGKLTPPVAPARLVSRERIARLLVARARPPVTVVCAPAGFGKTTLVLQWLADRGVQPAWYTLDGRDSEPARFVAHLVASLQRVVPGIARDLLDAVLKRESGADANDIAALVGALQSVDHPIVVVLDDYHKLQSPAVDRLVDELLENQPTNVELILTSRDEPRLTLARLRSQGRVLEVREKALRFTRDEAIEFVRGCLGLELNETSLGELHRRTEGWVAGLQLAGLSLRDVDDAEAFLAGFDSRDRYVADYLTEEVIGKQPEDVRQFLLTTSILDRMNADLAEAVSGLPNGGTLLQQIEQQSLFLVALDGQREWYRFHSLFGGLLRHQLSMQAPGATARCHVRASDWFASKGFAHEAIEHALSAGDSERAARVIDDHGWQMVAAMQARQVASWGKAVGDEALYAKLERLFVVLVADFISGGVVSPAWIDRAAQMASDDQDIPWAYGAMVACIRGVMLGRRRRFADAARVFDEIRVGGESAAPILGTLPMYCRAMAAYWRRDLSRATELLEQAAQESLRQRAGASFYPAMLNLMEVHRLRGDWAARAALLRRATDDTLRHGWQDSVGMGWLAFSEGEAHYAANELDAAGSALQRAVDLARFAGSNTIPLLATMRLAMVARLRGDQQEALALATDAAQTVHLENVTYVFGLYDWMLPKMWLLLGRPDEADRALRAAGVMVDGDIDPAREEVYIELARCRVHAGRPGEAVPLLARMLASAEAGGRRRNVVEIMVLQALARHNEDGSSQSDALIRAALAMGALIGDLRVFLDAGPGIAALLRRAGRADDLPAPARELLDTLLPAIDAESGRSGEGEETPQRLLAPLSRKELRVMRLLAAGHTNDEIASTLFISGNTVKTHLRHLFAKLGVGTRAAAIARAGELRLLEPGPAGEKSP